MRTKNSGPLSVILSLHCRGVVVSSISLKNLQVVDCVIEKCMMLTPARARDLCIYLLCAHGADRPARRPGPGSFPGTRDRRLVGQTSASGDVADVDLRTSDDRYDDDDDGGRLRQQEGKWNVNKRWQYPDPLQHCIQTYCQEHRGVGFYTCVYKSCISALLNTQFPSPV